MPICNEAAHLARALDAVDRQTYPADRIEIIVVDGGSSDDTLGIVRRRMERDPRLRLLGGEGVNTPRAMEIGIEAARGDMIAKVDGHGWISDGFMEIAIRALTADPSLGCVGGRIQPVTETDHERGIAHARFSRLGVGDSVYTLDERVQETDTVQCGVYRRKALVDAGGFDSDLPYGEDEEANFRLRQHGWRILLDPRMRFSYRVRPSIGALFRQYFNYGRARVAVVRKHPTFFRVKHALPAVLVAALVGSLPLALFPGWRIATGIVWIGYSASIAGGSTYLAASRRFGRADLIARSLLALHLGYGLGTLRGLLDSPHGGSQRGKRSPRARTQGGRMAEKPDPQEQDS